jgi:hypothetical protein
MASIFGFGGVKIGNTEFATSWGKLWFERVDVRNVTVNGKVLVHFKGWRPIMETEIIITGAADVAKLATVFSTISESQETGQSFNIFPRYLSTDNGSLLSYTCFLDSDITPEDIAQVDVGQTVKLRWIGRDLTNILPTNYSGQTTNNAIDASSNKLVDNSGQYIVLF